MSAICAIVHFDGRPAGEPLIGGMIEALAHRGRDGTAHRIEGSVALGHVMLRTTPQSIDERQPLANEDGSCILIMDGRIDNGDELRATLLERGAKLRTACDAELVLRAYEMWGEDCPGRLDGDFALAVWDQRRKELFCARDRFGLKPFVYHWTGTTLAIASELRAILDLPWVEATPNEGMIAEILSHRWLTTDETIWSGVMRLKPAHRMRVGGDGPRLSAYWKPEPRDTLSYRKDEDYFAHYRDVLARAVRRQACSHVPVACEVSGGLDSTAIFALADQMDRKGELPAPALLGYTFDYEGDPGFDDMDYARATGAELGREIQEIPPTRMDLSWYRQEAQSYRDFPGFLNVVNQLGIFQKASGDGARVMLSGLGGDQMLAGTRSYYLEEILALRFGELARCIAADWRAHGALATGRDVVRHGLLPLAPQRLRDALRPYVFDRHQRERRRLQWLTERLRQKLIDRGAAATDAAADQESFRGRQSFMFNLLFPFDSFARELVERLASRSGLEVRHPFYDRAFVDFALALPMRLRLRGSVQKYVHVEGLRGLMPERVRARTGKATFDGFVANVIRAASAEIEHDVPARIGAWLDGSQYRAVQKKYVEEAPEGWESWVLWNSFALSVVAFEQ